MSRVTLLEERIVQFLKKSKRPITQAELVRQLNVDSRLVSRALARLERRGLIRRERVVLRGRRTFRIYPIPRERLGTLKVPCFACPYLELCGIGHDYDPSKCEILSEWLLKVSNK